MLTLDQFSDFMLQNNLCTKQDKLLLAVSGGADSMVLCDLVIKSGFTFGIAHCNFNLRGANSMGDETFVEKFAITQKIPLHCSRFDTSTYAVENKLSIEEAARNLRYQYFQLIVEQFGYTKIVTAHHANDNAETLLLRLTKGTGLHGLRGIPLINKNIIRPLLFCNKAEIDTYCNNYNISFRIDESNAESIYQRNLIRNEIVPKLEEINPAFVATMQQNILNFEGAYRIYADAVKKRLFKLIQHKGADRYIPIAALGDRVTALTLLHELLSPNGFNNAQITQLYDAFGNTGKIFYSESHRVLIDRKFLILTEKKSEQFALQNIEKANCKLSVGYFIFELEESNYHDGIQFNSSGLIAYFDAALISYPLQVRKWQAGDYLYPLGLTKKKSDKPGKKKVSDILTNAKIDHLAKENTYVVLCGDKIIWLAGHRQDERFKVTRNTKRLLKIKMLPSREHS
ncbi:MAG: tRNA lysidine(34) synthetase TilS [Chitinophagales bacterium]